MRIAAARIGGALLLVISLSLPALVDEGASGAAPPSKLHRMGAAALPGRYIVVLRDAAGSPNAHRIAGELASRHGGRVRQVFQHAANAAVIDMSESAAVAMSADARVELIEEDAL